MNELQVFENMEFGKVRILEMYGESWFVGKDVTEILGYQNASKAISDHVDDEDKLNNESLSSLGQRGGWLINESGLYSLILSSKLEGAKRFKHWITSEVIPSIRKHGGYISGQEQMDDQELMARALVVAMNKIEEKNRQIKEQGQHIENLEREQEEMKPKAFFADSVSLSDDTILIRDLAKIIQQNGKDMGEKRLFCWLRDNGYLIRKIGKDYNMPTQRSMEMGLFRIRETSIVHSDGAVTIGKTPRVTGKGQVYFVNKLAVKEA